MRPRVPLSPATAAVLAAGIALASSAGGAAENPAPPATPPPPAAQAKPQVRNIGGPGDYPLREKLVNRMIRDPELASARPSIILVNGGAVFSGEVPTWTVRRRALALAGSVRGIVNVTDQMTVPRGNVKDEEILKGMAAILKDWKEPLEIADLDISVQDGVATLRGKVKNFAARVRAEEAAGTVLGAQTIVNRLRPANAPAGTDDPSIRKAIAKYLGDFRDYPYPATLEVAVKDGRATLTGEVPIYLGRQQAGTMAALVGGVQAVENRIRVEPSSQLPDTTVREVP
ncbi:MAG TPA: BON domain-containing protein [Candidatus Polarisedimenticolia bacterium]|nr:BON domain-containing protein [Candidatus Polarisedimenticolia bacterium]